MPCCATPTGPGTPPRRSSRSARASAGARWRRRFRPTGRSAPGDRVMVMLPNCPEVTIAYAAAWRAGAAAMPVVFLMGPTELAHVLTDSGAVVAVTSPEFLGNVLGAAATSSVRSVVVVGGVP